MSRRASRALQARQRERERRRAQDQRRQQREVDAERAAVEATRAGVTAPVTAPVPASGRADAGHALGVGRRVAGQRLGCGWCGQAMVLRATGRPPKWCSQTCRQRAWEHARAAASGQAAVQVVDRYIAAVPADGPGWITQLHTLAAQLSDEPGQIGEQHLDQLAAALDDVQAAVVDRTRWRRGQR